MGKILTDEQCWQDNELSSIKRKTLRHKRAYRSLVPVSAPKKKSPENDSGNEVEGNS